jgi:TetR/AcrR family transcriptional regulator, transcriptional repressor of aconitase
MPKVTQAHRDARRAQILDGAISCFARRGFHTTTMRDIVRQSRLSPGAIYNYFTSKEQIIEAIADERHDREAALIKTASREPSLEKTLMRIRDSFLGELDNPKERIRRRVTIHLWAEARRNPKILKLIRRGINGPRALLSNIFVEAQRQGKVSAQLDPDAAARFCIAAFHGLVLQMEWDDTIKPAPFSALFERFLDTLLQAS